MGLTAEIEKLKTTAEIQKDNPEFVKGEVEKPKTEIEKLNEGSVEQESEQEQPEKQDDGDDADDDSTAEIKQEEQETEKPDNREAAKLRRKADALERQLEELRRENQAAQQPKAEPQKNNDPEPDPDDVEAHLRWELRQTRKEMDDLKEWRNQQEQERQNHEIYNRAINNFMTMEREFAAKTPDYEQATAHMKQRMIDGIMAVYPQVNKAQAEQVVAGQILQIANSIAAQGMNPVEEMYDMAFSRYGFQPKQEEQDQPKTKKASINTVAANKKKSVTSLSGGGSERHAVSMKDMTPAKLARLSSDQIAELIAQENNG